MKSCRVNKLEIGGDAPVRLMGVINVSNESFYSGSYVPLEEVRATAVAMIEQGADMIDIGARSTAPNTQAISGKTEAERIDAALNGTGRERDYPLGRYHPPGRARRLPEA